jgi:hypothetical protein
MVLFVIVVEYEYEIWKRHLCQVRCGPDVPRTPNKAREWREHDEEECSTLSKTSSFWCPQSDAAGYDIFIWDLNRS